MSMHPYTKELHQLCKSKGLRLEALGEGHYQIHGERLVNYWPESKKRTAYVAGEPKGTRRATPKDAVELAGAPKPDPTPEQDRYTPNLDKQKDPGLMEAAKSIMRKHGLLE